MNVAYNQISCADAAKVIGVDYSTVTNWCRDRKINCINISEGTKNGRYVLAEDEVAYIKTLKQKFGKYFIKKYRKDWKRGMMPAEPTPEVKVEAPEVKPVASIKSVVVNITKEEPDKSDKIDIDEIAISTAEKELKKKLKKDEEVIDKKTLKKIKKNSKIEVEVFFKVKEDITDYLDISDVNIEEPSKKEE